MNTKTKSLFAYIFPALGGLFVTYLYNVVDGIFVGQGMGRGDKDGANHAFMTAFSLTVLLSVLLMVVGMAFSQQIVDLSGAGKLSEEMRKMSADYLFYYSAFSIPMLMSTCLSVFVRNDGSPALSFAGMCVGAAANIFWDWLFIFPLDMGVPM